MEENLCNIELLKDNSSFLAKVQSELGGQREYRSANFEEILEQLVQDLQDEFETAI